MITKNGYFKCDFCGGAAGEFTFTTGNHTTCELRARIAELETAANNLVKNLPESEIDLARESIGNTNANIILNYRNKLQQVLMK